MIGLDRVKEISVNLKCIIIKFFEPKLEKPQKTLKKEVRKEKKPPLKPIKPKREKTQKQKHQQDFRKCLSSKKRHK